VYLTGVYHLDLLWSTGLGQIQQRARRSERGKFWDSGENGKKAVHRRVYEEIRDIREALTGEKDHGWVDDDDWLEDELRHFILYLLKIVQTQMLVVATAEEEGDDQENVRAASEFVYPEHVRATSESVYSSLRFYAPELIEWSPNVFIDIAPRPRPSKEAGQLFHEV
jgi:hypothetical protein